MRQVKNNLKTAVLLAGLGGLLMAIGGILTRGSPVGFIIGGAIGFAFVGFSYWKSDVLAIKAARAVPVTREQMPEYYEIMEELTQKAGMPMPKLYVAPSEQPNAFATGRNPDHAAVAVTQGILRILTWEELRGVLAHEISHVGNRDILIGSVAAAIALGITMIANILQFTAIFGGGSRDDDGGNPIAMLAMALLAPLAAGLLQMALSRGREFEADRTGARLIGEGEPLARALEKLEAGAQQIPMQIDPAHAQAYIVNPLAAFKGKGMTNLFRTHPSTQERVRRLRAGEWQKSW
jgi:heat shock protein HtpX